MSLVDMAAGRVCDLTAFVFRVFYLAGLGPVGPNLRRLISTVGRNHTFHTSVTGKRYHKTSLLFHTFKLFFPKTACPLRRPTCPEVSVWHDRCCLFPTFVSKDDWSFSRVPRTTSRDEACLLALRFLAFVSHGLVYFGTIGSY